MRTTHERIVFFTSAAISGFATMALAAAATSTVSMKGPTYHIHSNDWSDTYCAPDACTRVAKTQPRGSFKSVH